MHHITQKPHDLKATHKQEKKIAELKNMYFKVPSTRMIAKSNLKKL